MCFLELWSLTYQISSPQVFNIEIYSKHNTLLNIELIAQHGWLCRPNFHLNSCPQPKFLGGAGFVFWGYCTLTQFIVFVPYSSKERWGNLELPFIYDVSVIHSRIFTLLIYNAIKNYALGHSKITHESLFSSHSDLFIHQVELIET